MIEAITAAGLEPSQAATTSAAQQPQASRHDIRDFAAAMERNGGAQVAQASEASTAVQATSQPSQGTRALLAAFDNLNGGAEGIRELSKTLAANPADFSPGQVIQMTMQCHQFMFQCELTSNVANRTSDGIQQLFRQQS